MTDQLLIEQDGLLVDPETGEAVEAPSFDADRITEADVDAMLERIAKAEGERFAAARLLAAGTERLTCELAKAQRKHEWLVSRFRPLLERFLRDNLRGKSRSINRLYGRVGLRSVRGSVKVVDRDAALAFAEREAPAAIREKVERSVSVELLRTMVDADRLPCDAFEVTLPRDVLYVETLEGGTK